MFAKIAVAATLAAVSLFAGLSAGGQGEDGERTITFHYTHFTPEEITVRAGEPVTFVLQNDDPIQHEWMVGDSDMHQRHRTGTEPYHDQIPTEVTVPAFTTKRTTVTFDTPGDYAYICHLPGHEEYGMKGVLHVR